MFGSTFKRLLHDRNLFHPRMPLTSSHMESNETLRNQMVPASCISRIIGHFIPDSWFIITFPMRIAVRGINHSRFSDPDNYGSIVPSIP